MIIKKYLLNLSKRQQIFIVLSLLLIFFIYSNSIQNGISSSNTSENFVSFFDKINLFENKIYLFVQDIFIKLLDLNKSEAKEVVIRKIAHITEFTVLSFCILNSFSQNILKLKLKQILLSINISFIVAFIDETIQLFSYGRSSQIQDVLIDFIGIIFGFVLFIILFFVIKMTYGGKYNGKR